jgi:hypothetical protein
VKRARMRLVAGTAVVLAAAVVTGGEAGSSAAATTPARALYGIAGPPVGLIRVDRATLQPLQERRVPLAGHTHGWSFSPDGARVALGTDAPRADVRLIDLRRMRVLGDVRVAQKGSVFATAWAGPNRVLAVVVDPGCCGRGNTTVAGIDAGTRRVLWRRTLGGALMAGARFRRSLVLVFSPRSRPRSIGVSRLVLVGPDDRLRTALLPEIRSGTEVAGGNDPARSLVRESNPGLAVDPSGARAFVVQAGAPVAEVDLRTLRVRPHALSEPVSLLRGLRDWLEPVAQAKATEGTNRHALWLGNGLLAVSGTDTHAAVDARGRQAQWDTPAGLKLIDTRGWRIRTLEARATSAVLASGTLLASSFLWDSRTQTISGSGLTGHALDGRRRFHLYGDDPLSGVQPLGATVLVGGAAGSRIFRLGAILDARTGRELRRVRFGVSLLVGDQPFWY